jgi:hypothetical protein
VRELLQSGHPQHVGEGTPLLDRAYTWSNLRANPVLAHLDRVLYNHEFNLAASSTILTSLARPTSDHTPLLIAFDTTIPKRQAFRFENACLYDPSFLPLLRPVWNANPTAGGGDMGVLATKLKDSRRVAKVWAKNKRTSFLVNNCNFVIKLLDLLEEWCFLSAGENDLRCLCHEKLAQLLRMRAAYWKQCSSKKQMKT